MSVYLTGHIAVSFFAYTDKKNAGYITELLVSLVEFAKYIEFI